MPKLGWIVAALAVGATGARADSSPPASPSPPSPYLELARDPLAPDPRLEWEVDLELPKVTSKKVILQALDGLWRTELHAQVMGPSAHGWQSLRYTDGQRFARVAVVQELFGQARPITAAQLEEIERVTRDGAKRLGATVRTPRPSEEGVATALALAKVQADCSLGLWILVTAPGPIDGARVRQILSPRGWVDAAEGKIAWRDRRALRGGEEQLSAQPFGTVDRWAFRMTVPRARDPIAVFEILRDSVEAVARELGGSLRELRAPYDPEGTRKKVAGVVSCLKAARFSLGESALLRIF